MGLCPSLITRKPVPRNLDSVTRFGQPEVEASDVGADAVEIEGAWRSVRRLYASGIHPAIQVCVRRSGEILLDRSIGYARGLYDSRSDGVPAEVATPSTPFNIFSASKAVTAMVIHLLDQRHLIHLDDPVCEYIPEFGTHGKQWITIRHVLTHRAGIPNIPPEAVRLEQLGDPDAIIAILCRGRPMWRPGRNIAYHAISGGFILGEIVRRVAGDDIRHVLAREISDPLKMNRFNYGVHPDDVGKVAVNHFTGPPVLPPLSTLLRRALGLDFKLAIDFSNDPRFLTAIVPAANIISTANDVSRFYQLLLNGGELDGVRVFEPRTIRRATSEQSYLEIDLSLGLPIRYGMGFMLGGERISLYGVDTPHAFGHLGFTNIISWADPERQVAGALLTSGKPILYPEIRHAFDFMRQIGAACPKVAAGTPARVRTRRADRAAVAS